MRWKFGLIGLAILAVVGCASQADEAKEGKVDGDKAKGTVVDLDGLKSTAPGSWVGGPSTKFLRAYEFSLAKVKDDTVDAEVAVFKNAGGDVNANVTRWKGLFSPPAGKTIDEVTTVSKVRIAGKDATYVDIRGTFRSAKFDPTFKGKVLPNFRMIGVQFQGPETVYHIKLTGPADTVAHYQPGFDAWLKGLKKE